MYVCNFSCYISHSDTAVLTGSLTWAKEDDENRTTARLFLSLTLALSQFPGASEGGRVYVTGALVDFGDGETSGDAPMPMEVYNCGHS